MEPKPTAPNDHERSITRRETLHRLAKGAGILLAVQIDTILQSFPAPLIQAATGRPKGEDMNQDRFQSQVLDDPYRLPRDIVPTRYDLRLEPDLTNAIFQGLATISLTVVRSTTVIILNALELVIESAVAEDSQGHRERATIDMDESLQRCTLTVPRPMAPGEWRLH